MGGAKHCSQCQTSHEGPVGRRCLENQQQEEVLGATSGESQNQASNIPLSEHCIDEQQAILAVTQVHNLQCPDQPHTSTGASSDSQGILLAELQKINQRFGKLEEQAAMDRQVLSGLESQLKHHTAATTSGQNASVSNTNVQKFASVKSPKIANMEVLGRLKDR